jgi:hypothetical protein
MRRKVVRTRRRKRKKQKKKDKLPRNELWSANCNYAGII